VSGAAAPARLKIVWAIHEHTGKILKTFPYPEKAAAQKEAQRLIKAKGKEYYVRPEKVVMDSSV